jgi:hypothetical protein
MGNCLERGVGYTPYGGQFPLVVISMSLIADLIEIA